MIIWYGERGVVNALVTYLVQKEAAGEFLQSIQWANGSSPLWLKNLVGTKFIIEVGLAEFGNPDLILVCESSIDPRPFCIFLEAKVIPYSASAISNDLGMRARGFNSACNGQLSLKYRFAKALAGWDGKKDKVEEPAAIHGAYARAVSDGGLGDSQSGPRKLQKASILKGILAPLGMAGLPMDHFSFVALTWDRDAFFNLAPEYLPKFYDENGLDIFPSMAGQNGWLGYQHLTAVPGLVDAVKPALDLMVGSIMPTEIDVMSAKWPRLVLQCIEGMGPEIKERMRGLELTSAEILGREAVQTYPGSISIKSPSRVEAKIVPQERDGKQFVMLGIRPEWPIENWSGREASGYRVMDQPFRFVKLPTEKAGAIGVADSILRRLSEVLDAQNSQEPNCS